MTNKHAARNPSILSLTLAALARNENWMVRYAVACNVNTPAETLAALAGDKDEIVRWGVANNPKKQT